MGLRSRGVNARELQLGAARKRDIEGDVTLAVRAVPGGVDMVRVVRREVDLELRLALDGDALRVRDDRLPDRAPLRVADGRLHSRGDRIRKTRAGDLGAAHEDERVRREAAEGNARQLRLGLRAFHHLHVKGGGLKRAFFVAGAAFDDELVVAALDRVIVVRGEELLRGDLVDRELELHSCGVEEIRLRIAVGHHHVETGDAEARGAEDDILRLLFHEIRRVVDHELRGTRFGHDFGRLVDECVADRVVKAERELERVARGIERGVGGRERLRDHRADGAEVGVRADERLLFEFLDRFERTRENCRYLNGGKTAFRGDRVDEALDVDGLLGVVRACIGRGILRRAAVLANGNFVFGHVGYSFRLGDGDLARSGGDAEFVAEPGAGVDLEGVLAGGGRRGELRLHDLEVGVGDLRLRLDAVGVDGGDIFVVARRVDTEVTPGDREDIGAGDDIVLAGRLVEDRVDDGLRAVGGVDGDDVLERGLERIDFDRVDDEVVATLVPRALRGVERTVDGITDRGDAVDQRDIAAPLVFNDVLLDGEEDGLDRRGLEADLFREVLVGFLLGHRAVVLHVGDVEGLRGEGAGALGGCEFDVHGCLLVGCWLVGLLVGFHPTISVWDFVLCVWGDAFLRVGRRVPP